MSRTVFAALLVALLAVPAAAQITLTGEWDTTIQSPQGTNPVTMTLTQDGEMVAGRVSSPIGELPVTGALTGDDLKIAFTLPIQGQTIDIVMTGKVEGPTLAGKVQFGGFGEGDWTATRAEAKPAGAPGGASGEWDFTFKTPRGDVPATATINQDGGTLSGTLSSQIGQAPFTGTLEGTSLRITSNLITPRGTVPMTMKGRMEGDATATGKAKIKGMGKMKWTAKRKQ
jgi:hypothetical protein